MDLKAQEIDPLLAPEVELGYEEERLKLKLGHFFSIVMIIQSTVGMSVFTLHQPLSKVGPGIGLLVSLFSTYVTIYGTTRLNWLASKLEAKHSGTTLRIKNVYEIFSLMPGKYMGVIKWLGVASNICLMAVSTIGNLCLFGRYLSIKVRLCMCTLVSHHS